MLFAFICAIGYTAASLAFKSALGKGASAAQVNFAANLAMALLVQPLWLFDRPEVPNPPLWQPLVCCVTFFVGQLFTFAALKEGDVSVATPLLGAKIVMVTALNALLFGMPISGRWWLAAIGASVGIAIIAAGAPRGEARQVATTALLSLGAALSFSFTDVFVQHWGGASDEIIFLPAMFGMVGIFSTGYYLILQPRAALSCPGATGRLWFGAALLGLQAAGMFLTLVWTNDATGANICYASRSIWSVAAAWAGGRLIGLRDPDAGAAVMLRRLSGALLLFGAIFLILK